MQYISYQNTDNKYTFLNTSENLDTARAFLKSMFDEHKFSIHPSSVLSEITLIPGVEEGKNFLVQVKTDVYQEWKLLTTEVTGVFSSYKAYPRQLVTEYGILMVTKWVTKPNEDTLQVLAKCVIDALNLEDDDDDSEGDEILKENLSDDEKEEEEEEFVADEKTTDATMSHVLATFGTLSNKVLSISEATELGIMITKRLLPMSRINLIEALENLWVTQPLRSDICNMMGFIHELNQDSEPAVFWYRTSASLGNPLAMFNLLKWELQTDEREALKKKIAPFEAELALLA